MKGENLMSDIIYEDWTAKHQIMDEADTADRNNRIKRRQRYLRFRSIARKIFALELGVIGIEALYRFGSVIRGYDSIGGESLVLIALAGAALWYVGRK